MRAWTSLLLLFAASACGSGAGAPVTDAGAGGAASAGAAGDSASSGEVELGVPGGSDGLDFAPFEPGAELDLHTFGQGGTHVLLAVRCVGFGSRAFVELRVENLNSGVEITAPAPARAQLLFCTGEVCDLVPITLMMGGLTENDAERDGLPIRVTARVHNAAGVSGEASLLARLSTALL